MTRNEGAYDWESVNYTTFTAEDVSEWMNATEQDKEIKTWNDNMDKKPSDVCTKSGADVRQ